LDFKQASQLGFVRLLVVILHCKVLPTQLVFRSSQLFRTVLSMPRS